MNIGSNIRRLRKKQGLTQLQIANSLEMSKSMVSQYERETKELSLKNAYSLTKILNCKLEDLIK